MRSTDEVMNSIAYFNIGLLAETSITEKQVVNSDRCERLDLGEKDISMSVEVWAFKQIVCCSFDFPTGTKWVWYDILRIQVLFEIATMCPKPGMLNIQRSITMVEM